MIKKFVKGVKMVVDKTIEFKKWLIEQGIEIYKHSNNKVKIVLGTGILIISTGFGVCVGGSIIADGIGNKEMNK